MNRRALLARLGSLTAAGVVITGSGAFTSVNAERKIETAVADDDDAFLSLEPVAKYNDEEWIGRSGSYGDVVWFKIPGNGDGESSMATGVGKNSIYKFRDLLTVENQGTQPVELYSTYEGNKLADLALINDGVLRDDPPTLAEGESMNVGIQIDTHGSDTGEFEETLTIVAEQPDD